MKRVIKKSLVLIIMLVTMISYADKNITNTEKVTNLKIENVKKGSVLTIKDTKGLILYTETIETSGDYNKRFDLTFLPDGDYFFELDKDVEIKIIPFQVKALNVIIKKEDKKTVFKPIVYYRNKKVYISRMSLTNEPLDVKIYFENGQLIKSEIVKKKGNFLGKVYDFSKAEKGNYFVNIRVEGKLFESRVKL